METFNGSIDQDFRELQLRCLEDNQEHLRLLQTFRPQGFYVIVGNGRYRALLLNEPIPRHNERRLGFFCPQCRTMVEPIGRNTKTICHCNGVVEQVPHPGLSFSGLAAALKYATLPRFRWSPYQLFKI